MRNRNYFKAFLALVVVAILGFTGCKKTPPPPKELDPTITLDGGTGLVSGDVTVTVGDSIRIKGIASKGKDGAKLKTFEWVFEYPAVPIPIKITKDITGETSYAFDTTISVGNLDGTLKITITVTDKDGRSATRVLNITIQQAQQATPPKSKTGVVLTYDSQNNSYSSSFFSSANMTVYNAQQAPGAASSIDIAYFYSGTSEHNLVSPLKLNDSKIFTNTFAISWGQVNTIFRKHASVTPDSITRITDETVLQQLWNDATNVQANCGVDQNGQTVICDGTRANNSKDPNVIAPNSVLLFKGANGKYGAIIIKNTGTSSLTLDIYVQN